MKLALVLGAVVRVKALFFASTVVGIVFLATACEGKIQKMSNTELAKKQSECARNNPTSPGRVTACENIKKECEARRKKKVFYGC